MRHKDFLLRCGLGAAVVATSVAVLSSAGVKASGTPKKSGLAGISLVMDAAYSDGENKIVRTKLDSNIPVHEIISLAKVNSKPVTGVRAAAIDQVLEGVETPDEDDSDEGSEGNKTGDEMESTEEEVKSKYENIGISVADPYVNIRSKANTESRIIGKLYKGSKCDILKEKGDWVKIESGNAKGYIKSEFLARGFDAEKLIDDYGTKLALVDTETLNVRFEHDTDSRIATQVPRGEKLLILQKKGDWYEVSINNGAVTGWVSSEFVKVKIVWKHAITVKEEEAEAARKAAAEEALRQQEQALEQQRLYAQQARPAQHQQAQTPSNTPKEQAPVYKAGSGTGSNIANFALKFVGNPYVWGGTSLTNGADCSGFVMSVYRNFGIGLNRTSRAQASNGRAVSLGELTPGDLVFYAANGRTISHVAMYIGGGKVVHASTPRTGIIVSSVYHQSPCCARRIVN